MTEEYRLLAATEVEAKWCLPDGLRVDQVKAARDEARGNASLVVVANKRERKRDTDEPSYIDR